MLSLSLRLSFPGLLRTHEALVPRLRVPQYAKLHIFIRLSVDTFTHVNVNEPSSDLVSREPKTIDVVSFLHCVIIYGFVNIRATGRDIV